MTWTAVVTRVSNEAAKWTYVIAYSDGTQTIERIYTADAVSDDAIERTSQQEIERLEAASAAVVTYKAGEVVDPPAQQSSTPSPEQQAKIDFMLAMDRLQRLQRAANLGVVQPDDARIAAAQSEVRARWQDSYLDSV